MIQSLFELYSKKTYSTTSATESTSTKMHLSHNIDNNKFLKNFVIIFSLSIIMISSIQSCECSPIDLIKNKLLFDDDNHFKVPSTLQDDLQKNSARLHRTLFLLDTSDLLKKARLLGVVGDGNSASSTSSLSSPSSSIKNDKLTNLLQKSSRLLFRFRREAKPPTVESTKYINIIKVRKPFLSLHEDKNNMIRTKFAENV